jgi:hypothetical protein
MALREIVARAMCGLGLAWPVPGLCRAFVGAWLWLVVCVVGQAGA